MARRWFPALLPLALLIGTGLRGIDFGFHWDEDHHVRTVQTALRRGAPLPGEYRYPSFSFWLVLAGAAPEILGLGVEPAAPGSPDARLAAVAGKPVRLRTRGLFLLVSSLAVGWVYGLVLAWRGRSLEALAAASVLGLSWEVGYHLRWIAPDGLLMMLGAAALAACVLGRLRPKRRGWLRLASVAAGLACGTKWPAGLLLLPLAVATWQTRAPGEGTRALLWRALGLGVLFGLSSLLTTPGMLLEPRTFWDSVRLQQGVYSRGHGGHTVGGVAEHLARVLEYYALAFGGRSPWIAVGVFACFVTGLVALLRESRAWSLLVLSFPAAYLAFFAFFPVMIPRNYLILAPFFAVLAARGLRAACDALRAGLGSPWPSRAVGAVAVLVALANAAWLVIAAESVARPRRETWLPLLAAHLDAHPEKTYAASPGLRRRLERLDGHPRPGLISGPLDAADEIVFDSAENYPWMVGATPRFDLTTIWFGPYEVNYNLYPSWLGSDRLVVMPVAHYPRRRALRPEHTPPELRPGALR